MKQVGWGFLAGAVLIQSGVQAQKKRVGPMERAQQIIKETRPLPGGREGRLPFIVWGLQNLSGGEEQTRTVLQALGERGIADVTGWRYGRKEQSLEAALKAARMHRDLGLPVVVNTTGVMQRFCNGDERTAHVDRNGKPFFDLSHSERVKIGCPFALSYRYPAIRDQVAWFVDGHKQAGLPLDILVADWEIDGPIEWNDSWQHAKRCTRCRENIPDLDDFRAFQRAYRRIRADMQRLTYADTVKASYPDALVGNYAEYPNDGFRYWYDYFEKEPVEQPHLFDRKEPYRPWSRAFADTGYTFAMPVIYTWYRTFDWYDFEDGDYRWFYNMLKVASNAGKNTPANIPIISFVHWHTTSPPKNPAAHVTQFSEEAYQELLWHMLLRGHDGFAMWCMPQEIVKETKLVHEVYRASMQFNEFILAGKPVCFHIPENPAPVVSGLLLGDRLLVRRTDFGGSAEPVTLKIGRRNVSVPSRPGRCQILRIEP